MSGADLEVARDEDLDELKMRSIHRRRLLAQVAEWRVTGVPARLLAAPGLVPASTPQVASVGSPKLLVEVPDAATLHRLHPDLEAITAWGKEAGINGIYAWCRLPDGRFEGRNFNHLDPALEDGATGVAAGALTALLGHGITLLQGRAARQSCLIRTRMEDGTILVGGRAEPAAAVTSFMR